MPGVAPRTRDEVLRVAARLFAQRGYQGTSVEDIGAACGISGPAIYKHFANKNAILARLLVEISEQLLEGGRAVVDGASSPRTALTSLIAFHTDFALGESDLIRVQDRDLASLNEPDRRKVRRLQRAYVEVWVKVLQDLDGRLDHEVGRTRAQAIFGLLNSTPHSARAPAVARDQLMGMAHRALSG